MTSIVVGNPRVFAIESGITRPYEQRGQRALGFFVIYIGGVGYGVRSPDATLLACSLDAVNRRIARRGMHRLNIGVSMAAAEAVDAVRTVTYEEEYQGRTFFGMPSEKFRDLLTSSEVIWAPDGDAAFDDGSHVLQFDEDERVRLIGFKNAKRSEDVASTLKEIWINSDEFYALLDNWQHRFEAEWISSLANQR